MEWIEKHGVLIMLIIAALSQFAQILWTRWEVRQLGIWRRAVDLKLGSIDMEINQIKIGSARDSQRMQTLEGDVGDIKRRLEDFHETFIMALSSGTLQIKRRPENT